MGNTFVVGEWAKPEQGEEMTLRRHPYAFATYEEANRWANLLGPACFPQQVEM
jgi:hypothetical protein